MTPTELHAARLARGLTQEELAAQLGVRAMTVSRWERGFRKPSRMALRLIEAWLREQGAVK